MTNKTELTTIDRDTLPKITGGAPEVCDRIWNQYMRSPSSNKLDILRAAPRICRGFGIVAY